MSDIGDNPASGCIIILAIIMAAPFFIAACPILAGIAIGVLFYLAWCGAFALIWNWFTKH